MRPRCLRAAAVVNIILIVRVMVMGGGATMSPLLKTKQSADESSLSTAVVHLTQGVYIGPHTHASTPPKHLCARRLDIVSKKLGCAVRIFCVHVVRSISVTFLESYSHINRVEVSTLKCDLLCDSFGRIANAVHHSPELGT
jgi:hypothetical protein